MHFRSKNEISGLKISFPVKSFISCQKNFLTEKISEKMSFQVEKYQVLSANVISGRKM